MNDPKDPKPDPSDAPVTVRLSAEVLARVDALQPLFAVPGQTITRSDVLRALILDGLEYREKPKKGGRR